MNGLVPRFGNMAYNNQHVSFSEVSDDIITKEQNRDCLDTVIVCNYCFLYSARIKRTRLSHQIVSPLARRLEDRSRIYRIKKYPVRSMKIKFGGKTRRQTQRILEPDLQRNEKKNSYNLFSRYNIFVVHLVTSTPTRSRTTYSARLMGYIVKGGK